MTIVRPLLAAVFMVTASLASADTDPRLISVTGEGQVDVAPDMATITVGVTHEAEVASDAMSAVSDSVSKILNQLEEQGIAASDMQTSGLSLNPVWSNRVRSDPSEPARITGFVARNAVSVRVRALDKLGGVLDAVIADGANDLSGIRFGVQEPDALMDEARRDAVADAMARAELLAEAAGVTLGPLQSLSEHGGGRQPMMMEMAASRSADVPIAAGEVSITASVSMVFTIAD